MLKVGLPRSGSGDWMVLDQGEPQRCSFGIQSRVEIYTAKTLVGLGDGGLQQAQVSQTGHASGLLNQATMQLQHLRQPQLERRRDLQLLVDPVGSKGCQQAAFVAVDAEHGVG